MVKPSWHIAISISYLLGASALHTSNGDGTNISQQPQSQSQLLPSRSPISRLFRLIRRQTSFNLPPRPQLPPQIVSSAAKHDLQCKNCPYSSCLNALVIENGFEMGFACWTQGEEVAADNTWLRHQYGSRPGDFCYVNPYDLREPDASVRQKLPYCGERSEMNFFLPVATTTTELPTACALCPFTDCEVVQHIPAGVAVDVNCFFNDGSELMSTTHINGTTKYYRTRENCFVSGATVQEIAIPVQAAPGSVHFTQILPPCGPIPHVRLDERPSKPTQDPRAQSLPSTRSSDENLGDLPRIIPGEPASSETGASDGGISDNGSPAWENNESEEDDINFDV